MNVYLCFIDYSKAFDYIVRDNTLLKLSKLDIRGKLVDIIKAMYQNVKAKVKCGSAFSDSLECR